MQREYGRILDNFGNPWEGATITVYLTGTTTKASIYSATNTADNPSSTIGNPVTTGSDGRYSFAVNDGDYDILITYPDASTYTQVRRNFFDSTTSTTIPVSSISFAAPAQFAVTGSPGTSISMAWNNQSANQVLAGPTSGGAAAPTFRALVTADITTIAVDLVNAQTAAGAKIWSSAATFSSTVTFNGAVTNASTLTQTGTATFDADVVLDKDSLIQIDKTTPASGYAATFAQHWHSSSTGSTTITGTITAPSFADAATNNKIGELVLPFEYQAATDIIPFILWAPSGTNTGTCRFGLEYSTIKAYNQGVFPAATTIYVETAASSGAQNQVYTSEFAAITGTNFEPNTVMSFRLFRDGTHANDTLTDAAIFLGFGVYYRKARFATKNRTPNFYT